VFFLHAAGIVIEDGRDVERQLVRRVRFVVLDHVGVFLLAES
jgi:hypothetical protein